MKRITENAARSFEKSVDQAGKFMESRWWLILHVLLLIPCLAALILLDSGLRRVAAEFF